ncbi:MAG: amino acid adenylation domain-containing protein, partial [Candidatus Baltobacteraceae bacterium]
LKAGCVYLPLDVAYPPERLAYMLADSGAALAIADAATAARLPAQLERILIDAPETFAVESGALPGRSHTPADPAYIIYTSGSTGKPKGVAVPHAAAVNLAFARLAHDPIGAGDRILAAISVGFDVSIGQLLLPLLSGATVVVAGDLRSLGAREFWDFLGAQRVTHVNSVPSFFESVLDAAPASPSLVRLMLGGEPLASALARRLREALPHTDVYNMYGPTEACIDATCYRVTGLEGEAVLPIGRPLPNYRAYVLDARLEPAGIGVAGDLFLAGAGLAQAYVNAPALTAERFIADPFGAPGERLYRTGDRARRRADGSLEFLGRADMQVKIRGHRVELGEIEAALRAHPFIAAAAVVAGESPAGPARLVAYCVPRAAGSSLDGASLRAHLAGRLPEYMLPAAFVTIAALPLTPNGKLDQQALPAVDWQAARAHVAPRGESELRVAALFAELLEIERAGASDHFFELGGHSLLATRLVSALRSRFGVAVPLRAVFEAPTVAALARYLDGAAGGATRAFVALPRPERLPLSFTQERLWFLSALLGDATYNVPFAVRIGGALESARAVRVLEQIVARHEALRTCIVMHEGRPGQEIRPPASFAVRTLDLSGASGAQQAGALAERLNALAQARFDLSADLPVKIELIALGPGSHVLAGVAHHASFDGWSAKVFFEEFARLYAAGAEPRAVQPLALHFADFALWQREADFSREIAFWRERLAGAPPVLEFPADRPPAGGRRLPAGVVPIALDEALGAALLEVANAAGASLFMLLHAAFASMLARWSGQTDLVVGTVTANRPYAEFEPVIGCFVNTLALRTRVPPLATFAQLLAATREDDLAAFEHQAVPFERLVEVLQPERALDQTPLFQAMLVLQNEAPRASDFAGLKVEPLALEPGPAKFNLTLNLAAPPSGAGLSGAFEYDAGRYDAATIERFSGQFVRLLRAVAADPQTVPLRAGLFDRGERAVLGAASRGVERAFPRGTADELFEQRARENPGALAVTGAAESLSYAELDARAGRLARRLAAHGLPAQSVVGVALERSVASVVSLLAILKAGHVYLPLDPAYPPGRLAHMLSDSGAKLAVSDTSLAAALPAGVARLLLDVPQGDDDVAAAAPPRRHGPDDLAYIVYTSGSSGTPKGVAVPHAAAVNLAFARLEHDPISAGDRILAAVSVGFDVSIGQLLLPLLSGAAIVVAGDLRSLSASEFWDFLEAQRVTHVNSVPSFFESVLPAAPAQSSLVRLMLGGEALGSALAARLRRALPHAQLFNMYGPTEACIDATCYAVSGLETEALLPIGRPLPNYRAYVLNALLEPAGIGIAGELYLAGPGLAQAYVGAPALTAERFVADPFGAPGSRMYETGDRARVRPDGQIEFLGRADTQVKIRGQRVELGEIEAQLARQSGVREVAVTVREDVPGDRRLVAYYTAAQPLQAAALREALGAALPAHMIPAAYVRLEALPLTTNGKLNREALPAPGAGAYGPRAFEPPQGESEELIAGIFAEALGLERVGRRDNFFELGGHSLLVMSVIERLAQAGRRVDVRALFAAPTVAGLAAAARDASGGVAVPPNRIGRDATQLSPEMLPLVQLTQAEIDAILARVPGGLANVADIYPLAPLQEGILFHHVTSRQGDAYLTPFVLGFDRRGRLERFLDALREIVARHDILRTAILWEGLSEPVQVVLREARLGVEEVTLDGASPAGAVEQLRERYDPRHHRIDVRRAPLLHAFVARDPAADRWLLLLLSHHLILDHSSLETILHEVELISSGRRSELPEPQPFRDFVAQARLGTPPQEHEAFFRRMLGDVDEPTAPYGLRHVEGDGSGIRESSLGLEASLARRLRERARALGVGPATIFHLAWALVLGHVSGRRDVVFGTLLFGRMHSGANAARTLGMFINTLPMRIKLDGCGVERAVLRTHEQLAGLLRHERASLALAQRCSGVPAPAPLFSALFNFRHSPAAADGSARAWPGVELLFAQERTDYPVALAVDDRTNDFLLTAQADAPVEPADLCRYLETALDNLVGALESAPLAPLRSVSVLPREEYAKAVHGCNRTEALFPAGTLHGLFEEQAARTPEAVAVTDGTNSLTYAELDVRAERLADLLAASGCERHSVVGVALPRSLETVVALLAILKAGGVYLPLDPAYPPERLRYALADSHAGLAVVNGETEALVAPAVT